MSVVELAGEWRHTCHILALLSPFCDGPQPTTPCITVRMPSLQHPMLYIQKSYIFYLLLSKDTLTKVHCLQPISSLLNNPPNPRAILIIFIVPYTSEYLTILNSYYFFKNNSTPPSEFNFRILLLLLFLVLFSSPCFVPKILTISSFDMLQSFFCSFRELLERVQIHNVSVKQDQRESFEFTSTNIS